MKKQNLLILAAAIATSLAPAAHADTFLQYSTTSSNATITFDGTTLTGTAIPVDLSYLPLISGAPATGTLNFSATAVPGTAGDAFSGLLYFVDVDDITFSITNGSTNILSGTEASGVLAGTDAGLTLGPPSSGGVATYTSDIYNSIAGLSIQIGIGPPDPDLSDAGGTLGSFDASAGTGAFSSTAAVTTKVVSAVPEPSSIALLGTGLLGFAGAIRRKLYA